MDGFLISRITESRFNTKYSKLKSRLLLELQASLMFRLRIFYQSSLKSIWWAPISPSPMTVNNWKSSVGMKRSAPAKSIFLVWLIDRLTSMLRATTEWKSTDRYSCFRRPSTKTKFINKSMTSKSHKNRTILDWSINFSLWSTSPSQGPELKLDWHRKSTWS